MTVSQMLGCLSEGMWRCRLCGTHGAFHAEQELETWWVACPCGHVFPTPNRVRWS